MIPCSLGKTLEIGDKVFTTNRSDTSTFVRFAVVVDFDYDLGEIFVITEGSPKSRKVRRKTCQLMCLTQQLSYNVKNYPENQL